MIEWLQKSWSASNNDEAVKVASDLINLPDMDVVRENAGEITANVEAPKFIKVMDSKLTEILQQMWPTLTWNSPCVGIKVCHLGSIEKNALSFRLIHIEMGEKFPQHNYKEATEILHILHANELAEIGICDEWTDLIKNDSFYSFFPTEPKTIKAGPNDVILAISVLRGHCTKLSWPNVSRGHSEGLVIPLGTGKPGLKVSQNVADYYDKLAENYDEAVEAWGYFMPEASIEALFKYAEADFLLPVTKSEANIVDLGCGNGLCGVSLGKKGLKNIVGLDISPKSLEVAQTRGCYKSLHTADLLKNLPLEDNQFDVLLCIGTTSYLNPIVLKDWLRVVKPGGILCFTHKSSVWPLWEPDQQQLENEKQWRKVWVHPGLPYLPSLKPDGVSVCRETVRIYIYCKTGQL